MRRPQGGTRQGLLWRSQALGGLMVGVGPLVSAMGGTLNPVPGIRMERRCDVSGLVADKLRRVLAIHAVQAGKREILNVHRWRRARVTSTKRPSC